jgi:putative membrane protein
VRELAPSAHTTSYHYSSIVGIAIVLSGGLMEIFALISFLKNRQLIKTGKYETTRGAEIGLSTAAFVVTVLLTIYLIVTL